MQNPLEKKFTVVLDAGHGGHDSGNRGNGFIEKNIALKIVLNVGRELGKNKNIKVIYTRDKDRFVTLRDRAKIANDADADLFVSIHCNAHRSSAYGTETFVLGLHANQQNFDVAKKENEVIYLEDDYELHYEGFDPNSPDSLIGLTLMQEEYLDQSIGLASLIENNFSNDLNRKTRGVKQAGFWVLHNTYMPSVLIETGFLSNKKEGNYLNSWKGQRQISKAIVKAIIHYETNLELNIGEDIRSGELIDEQQVAKERVVYRVQIAASSQKLSPVGYNFNGLQHITREKVGQIYKYFYGETSDFDEIEKLKTEAKSKGYKDCFVVAFKGGKPL